MISSNHGKDSPEGMGLKSVPKETVIRVVFSRLTNSASIKKEATFNNSALALVALGSPGGPIFSPINLFSFA